MNKNMIEAALGMLARVIPREEYQKANIAIGQIVQLLESIDQRAARTEQAAVYAAAKLDELAGRIAALESAAAIDSEAYRSGQAELLQWFAPGRMEKALAPAEEGALQNDH